MPLSRWASTGHLHQCQYVGTSFYRRFDVSGLGRDGPYFGIFFSPGGSFYSRKDHGLVAIQRAIVILGTFLACQNSMRLSTMLPGGRVSTSLRVHRKASQPMHKSTIIVAPLKGQPQRRPNPYNRSSQIAQLVIIQTFQVLLLDELVDRLLDVGGFGVEAGC